MSWTSFLPTAGSAEAGCLGSLKPPPSVPPHPASTPRSSARKCRQPGALQGPVRSFPLKTRQVFLSRGQKHPVITTAARQHSLFQALHRISFSPVIVTDGQEAQRGRLA